MYIAKRMVLETQLSNASLSHQRSIPYELVPIPTLKEMKFLTTVLFATLTLERAWATDASNPGVEVSVHPSRDSIDMNIQVGLKSLTTKSTVASTNNTLSAFRLDNITLFARPMTHAPCASGSHAHTRTSLLPITAVTQGFFLNTTNTPIATGRFQTPSLIDLASFSGDSSARGQPALSIMLAVATIHLLAVTVL